MTHVDRQREVAPRIAASPREAGVSACLIVRDEEENLARCLRSLRPFVDEVCVLDTGSTDRTVEIARACGAKVRHADWDDDFAAARNRSLEMATRRWILVVDADEELDPESGRELRRALEHPTRQGWLVRVDSEVGGGEVRSVSLPRLFRNRPDVRFRRRVHESVMESLLLVDRTGPVGSGVRLLHYGYRPEVLARRDKRARNLALLRRSLAEDAEDLYALHKLAAAVSGEERRDLLLRAVARARRLDAAERGSYPFLPAVFERLSRALADRGDLTGAITVADEALSLFGGVPELRYRRGDLARRAGDDRLARRLLASCVGEGEGDGVRVDEPEARGVRPMLGLVRSAVDAGRLDEARALVEHSLARAPGDVRARRFEIELKLLDERTQAEGLAALSWLVDEAPESPDVRVISGRFAWSSGDRDTALELWRTAAAAGGDAGLEAAGLLLVALLAEGDWELAKDGLAPDRILPLDVPSAAAVLLASVVLDRPLRLDAAFCRDALRRQLVLLLQELIASGDGRALERFAAAAASHESTLPGIGALVVDDSAP